MARRATKLAPSTRRRRLRPTDVRLPRRGLARVSRSARLEKLNAHDSRRTVRRRRGAGRRASFETVGLNHRPRSRIALRRRGAVHQRPDDVWKDSAERGSDHESVHRLCLAVCQPGPGLVGRRVTGPRAAFGLLLSLTVASHVIICQLAAGHCSEPGT